MSIKRIYSAGGIVLRPLSDDPVSGELNDTGSSKGEWQVLVIQQAKHKGWDFPKGHIESGESQESAALREVAEETGVRAEIIEKVGATQYFYWEEGTRILKTVTYYLMKYIGQGEAKTAFEVSGMKWLPPAKAEEQLTFRDTKELWAKVKDRIKKLEL